MSRERVPAVVVRHVHADPVVLQEVRAGLEEEGVPSRVEPARRGAGRDAPALAHAAARASELETGIGIDAAGAVAVHHATLPAGAPVLSTAPGAPAAEHRRAGRTAARVVTGQPL